MHGNSTDKRSDWFWMAVILAAGIALRAAAVAGLNHVPESDELSYQSMAANLLAGRGVLENGNRAFYNAGYPMFVLAPVYLVFGEHLLAARIANVALGAVSIVLCYLVAGQAGAGRWGRLLAAAVWALYLPSGVYSVYLAKENLMAPLMLGVLWCALRLASAPSAGVAAGCGVLLAVLAMTGNSALSLLGAVALALLLAPVPWRRRLEVTGVGLLVAAVTVSPWLIRNLQVVGSPVLNTNGGFNLYLGNNPSATGYFVSIADTPRGASWHQLRKEAGEVGAARTLRQEAVAWITAHPREFAVLTLKRGAYFWTPPLHEGRGGNASSLESLVRLVWAMQFVLMVAAALAGAFLPQLRHRRALVLWSAVACYTAAHMLFYVIYRYREPIMPIVAVLAALAVEAWLVARRHRHG